jgi:hypothetical protein
MCEPTGREAYDASIAQVAALSGPAVVGMLMWMDPCGQRWMAPLGAPEPDPDRPVPAEWAPIRVLPRSAVEFPIG